MRPKDVKNKEAETVIVSAKERNGKTQSVYPEEFWIDHLEGELDHSLETDLDILLENSPADRKHRLLWRKTRTAIKNAADVPMPESGEYYDKLHDKIMQKIDALDRKKDASSQHANACNSMTVKTAQNWKQRKTALTGERG